MADFYLDYRGSDYNGGGYDSTIAGATVNLASGQYAALTASGLECTAGSTTVTSVHGGFTTDMIGNYINIYNGYEYTFHCYAITGVPNSTSLELASSPSPSLDAVSGVGKVGGAWRTCDNFAIGGGVVSWGGKSKVPQAGDTVNIRGNGQYNPASGQYTGHPYFQIAGGTYENPLIYRGYNGRPAFWPINGNLFWHSSPVAIVENIKFYGGIGGWETQIAQINGALEIRNCTFDQYGSKARAFEGTNITNCYVYNSKQSETQANITTHPIIHAVSYANVLSNNVIENCVGTAISLSAAYAEGNVIHNIIGNGINQGDLGTHTNQVRYNTINGCTGTGIIHNRQGRNKAIGNLITNCSGVAIAETDVNYQNFELSKEDMDYNVLYNNGVNYSGYTGGNNDIFLTADPYNNEASGDLNLNNNVGGGKECRAAISIPIAGYGKAKNYRDAGGLQAYDK